MRCVKRLCRRFGMLCGMLFLCLLTSRFGMTVCAQAAFPAEQAETLWDEMQAVSQKADTFSADDALSLSKKAADALSPDTLWDFGLEAFWTAVRESFAVFPLLLIVILLSSVIGIFSENLGTNAKLLEFAGMLGGSLVVFDAVKPTLAAVEAFLGQYAAFMTSAGAASGVLMASTGQASAAAVSASFSAFMLGLLQLLSQGFIFPCVKLLLAFGLLSGLSKTPDLSGCIGFVRSFCTWGLGVLFAVFGGIQALAVHTAAGADNAAIRGIRFTAARLIPIAGNMLSECFRTVLGAAGVLKGAFGALGIAYILYLVIPTLCTVLSLKLAVLFGSFCSKLLGTRSFTAFLDSVGGALNILTAICLFASASGVILFASCAETALAV